MGFREYSAANLLLPETMAILPLNNLERAFTVDLVATSLSFSINGFPK